MNYLDIFATNSFVWPLTTFLAFLFVLKRVESQISPILNSTVSGLAKSAGSNATTYAIALGFGLSASLSAFYDVFNQLDAKSLTDISWHQYAALWAKVFNPFIVAVLAYATQSPVKPSGTTNPPFVAPHTP